MKKESNFILLKNSIFNIVYNLINVFFPLISASYAARILLPEGIGKVSYASNIVSYFVLLATLGLPSYGIKMIGLTSNDEESKRKTFSELFLINLLTSTIAIISFIVCLLVIPKLRVNCFLYLILGIQLIFCYFNVDWYFRGNENYFFIVSRNILIKILFLICLISFVKSKEDIYNYTAIISAFASLNYLVNFVYISRHTKLRFKNLDLNKHIKPILLLSVTLVFSTIYSKIDVLMLGDMASDWNVGIYENAHKIQNTITTACVSITAVFLPKLSYYYEKNKDSFIKLLNKGLNIIIFITIPSAFGVFILADNIINMLFGEAFAASAQVLKWFSLLIAIKGIGDLICYQMIISIGKEAVFVPVAIIAATINIGLNYVLIPIYIQNGAAIASVVSELILNSVLFIVSRHFIKYKIDFEILIKAIISTMFMSALVFGITKLHCSDTIICCIGVFGGLFVFFGSNLALKNKLLFDLYFQVKNKIGEQ
ncbi:MAG: flippase [Clostridia bacterium]|nr:flippase [Clostridia bacterium]